MSPAADKKYNSPQPIFLLTFSSPGASPLMTNGPGGGQIEVSVTENVILLVEDCTEDASLVMRAFKKWGITNTVHVAPDGEQAVEYLTGNGPYADRNQFPLPSLALLDLKLPQMSGFEVLEWVRSRHD